MRVVFIVHDSVPRSNEETSRNVMLATTPALTQNSRPPIFAVKLQSQVSETNYCIYCRVGVHK